MRARPCFPVGLIILVLPAAILSAGPDTDPSEPVILSHPLHFDVNLVQVDAVVTDSRGQRVSGLRAEDFEVYQDRKRQQITHFLYVPGAEQAAVQPLPVTRQLTRSEARRVFLIYIDDRTMSFAAFTQMRKALGRFINEEFQPGDLCAFFRTSGGPGAWRTFSSDPRQARAALDHMTWLRAPPFEQGSRALQAAIGEALHAMADLPGRKALVLVNSGVTVPAQSQFASLGAGRGPGSQIGRAGAVLFPMARSLADEANRVSAAVYCIDARGLAVIGPETATDYGPGAGGKTPRNSAELARQTLNMEANYPASQDVPNLLADMTGGLAFHDTNDLAGALHKISGDEQGYYLLGWDPGDKAFEPKGREILYHSLRIRVARPGLTVRSRAGYFGMPEGQRTHISARSRMLYALSSPFREDNIDVDLTASVQESADLGPHIECLLHVGPMGVDFRRDHNGCQVAHLDVAVLPQRLGEDVDLTRMHGQLATIQACGKSADTVLREGFVFTARQDIVPGPYEMHVVVRNVAPGEGPALLGPKSLITDSDPNATHPPVRIGSASEFVNAPDLRKSTALTGITLGLEGVPAQPSAGYTSWHVAGPGDPAIRNFHEGDAISYRAELVGGTDRSLPFGADLKVLFEGQPVYSEMIQPDGNVLSGVYRVQPGAPAGQYLLGITIPAKGGKEKGTSEEWINFQVVKE